MASTTSTAPATPADFIPQHSTEALYGCDGEPHHFFEGECIECGYDEEVFEGITARHEERRQQQFEDFWKIWDDLDI